MPARAQMADSYWVTPNALLAGEYPGSLDPAEALTKLRNLLSIGVTCFVDLTEKGEHGLRPYASELETAAAQMGQNVEHHRMPIRDVSVPSPADMVQILDLIDQKITQGHVVYVHCWGGVGRTGTVVGCYLARHGRAHGRETLAMIADLRRATQKSERPSPETDRQCLMVTSWREGE